LVTGSASGIGAAIAARLAEDYEVVGFDIEDGDLTTREQEKTKRINGPRQKTVGQVRTKEWKNGKEKGEEIRVRRYH